MDHLLVAPVAVVGNEIVQSQILDAATHPDTALWLIGQAVEPGHRLLIHPDDAAAIAVAEEWEARLSQYPDAESWI